MRNLSSKFRHEMYYNHTFDCLAEITLVNNTKLNLTNTELWTGGFTQDDSVSQDSSFTAIGAAVIGSASIIINNMDESYSDYDFTNAEVVLSLSKTYTVNGSDIVEPIRMGTYTVDDTAYNGATITLSLLDNMAQFDRPYTTNLSYPATLIDIVEDACLKCGVQLGTLTFPHQSYEVQTKPDKDNTTYRQVLSWAAAIAGCFARCNANGKLELKWFDTSLIDSHNEGLDGGEFDSSRPYSTGDTADGGSFNPWNTGYVIDDGSFETVRRLHYLNRLTSQTIGVDDVVITGVKVVTEIINSTTEQHEDKTYLAGTEDYVIELSGNEFITSDTANSVCTWLGNQLIGLRFRNGSVTHINDPSIEAGDVAIVVDRKGREYPFLITRTAFSASGTQTTECNAESPLRNSATQFSQATKAYVDARKLLNAEQTTREQAIQRLVDGLASKSGLYTYVETTQSGSIYYLHDKPRLEDSKTVWKMTDNAFGVTTDYNGEHPEQTVWNAGLTVDGTLIASIIDTIEISFSRGKGGTITLGGENNGNGTLRVRDANGDEIGRWNNYGIQLNKGSINLGNGKFTVNTGGEAVAKSFTANDYIFVDGNSSSKIRIPYTAWGTLLTKYTTLSKTGVSVEFGGNSGTGFIDMGEVFAAGSSSGRYPSNSFPMINTDFVDTSNEWLAHYHSAGVEIYKIRGTTGGYYWSYSELSHDYFTLNTYDANGLRTFQFDIEANNKYAYTSGSVVVSGTKSRLAETEDYNDRLLYCYETPSPMFGDVGEGVIGEDGLCYVPIDPVFSETVTTSQYQVFLQKYGEGDCYVKERTASYFVVKGTSNLLFGWELKAKQLGYEQRRLDDINFINIQKPEETDYSSLALEHINEINNERSGITNESSNISNNVE